MSTNRPVNVGAYLRVSRVMDRSGETFLSPDIQLNAVTAWADRQFGPGGWNLVETFRDMDQSGTSMDRTALREAFDYAEKGKIEVLALYDLSRWARCVADGISELEALANTGCRVASTSEQIDLDTPEGELSITFMLAVHQYRARQAAKSWQNAIAMQGERGRHHGRAPFGYTRAGTRQLSNGRIAATGSLIPDPMQREIVVEIFKRFAAGESAYSIENDLMARKLPQMRVRRLITNPIYIGKVIRREHVGKAVKRPGTKGVRRRLKSGDGHRYDGATVYDGQHEAIISQELWDQCAARLAAEGTSPRLGATTWAFSGLVVCDYCGMALIRQKKTRPNGGIYLYLSDVNGHRQGCQGPGVVQVGMLTEHVRAMLVAVADRFTYDLTDAITEARTQRHQLQGRIDALLGEHSKLTKELVDLARNRATIVGGDDIYQLTAKAIEDQRASLMHQVEALQAQLPNEPSTRVAEAIHSLCQEWDAMNEIQRNTIAREWIKQIRVRRSDRRYKFARLDGRIELVLREPEQLQQERAG